MNKRKLLRKLFKWISILGATGFVLIISSNLWIVSISEDYVYDDLDKLPSNKVGLVLGTSRYTSSGRVNLHFKNRMDAAAMLYKKGKIKHILASGDNQYKDYDEPTNMKKALMNRGVPEKAITLDYAGLRTLDSIVRAKEIFGLDRFTIISQEYHNSRAVFISRYYGLDTVAWSAHNVTFKHSIKTEIREYLARVKAVIDLYIIQKQPKFLGKKEAIVILD